MLYSGGLKPPRTTIGTHLPSISDIGEVECLHGAQRYSKTNTHPKPQTVSPCCHLEKHTEVSASIPSDFTPASFSHAATPQFILISAGGLIKAKLHPLLLQWHNHTNWELTPPTSYLNKPTPKNHIVDGKEHLFFFFFCPFFEIQLKRSLHWDGTVVTVLWSAFVGSMV